jgi:hypothetical protein
LPALAGLAIGLHDILIEPKRDCRFWLAGQGRRAAPDQPVALTQLAVAKEIAQQFRASSGSSVTGLPKYWRQRFSSLSRRHLIEMTWRLYLCNYTMSLVLKHYGTTQLNFFPARYRHCIWCRHTPACQSPGVHPQLAT